MWSETTCRGFIARTEEVADAWGVCIYSLMDVNFAALESDGPMLKWAQDNVDLGDPTLPRDRHGRIVLALRKD